MVDVSPLVALVAIESLNSRNGPVEQARDWESKVGRVLLDTVTLTSLSTRVDSINTIQYVISDVLSN